LPVARPGGSILVMSGNEAATMLERLRQAFEMHEAGVSLMLQNLRRAHPDATDEQIEAQLGAWLATRPGAELGDAPGTPRPWPI
jgi:hypothetical protein